MKSAVIVFPGLNRDRDMIAALTKISGTAPAIVWHQDADLPDVDLIVIPGGFSYGDYLRCGAIAAHPPGHMGAGTRTHGQRRNHRLQHPTSVLDVLLATHRRRQR